MSYRNNWVITHKSGGQVELRLEAKGANLLVILSEGGWNYKREKVDAPNRWSQTNGFDVRMSMNNSMWLTKDEFLDIMDFINEQVRQHVRPEEEED